MATKAREARTAIEVDIAGLLLLALIEEEEEEGGGGERRRKEEEEEGGGGGRRCEGQGFCFCVRTSRRGRRDNLSKFRTPRHERNIGRIDRFDTCSNGLVVLVLRARASAFPVTGRASLDSVCAEARNVLFDRCVEARNVPTDRARRPHTFLTARAVRLSDGDEAMARERKPETVTASGTRE